MTLSLSSSSASDAESPITPLTAFSATPDDAGSPKAAPPRVSRSASPIEGCFRGRGRDTITLDKPLMADYLAAQVDERREREPQFLFNQDGDAPGADASYYAAAWPNLFAGRRGAMASIEDDCAAMQRMNDTVLDYYDSDSAIMNHQIPLSDYVGDFVKVYDDNVEDTTVNFVLYDAVLKIQPQLQIDCELFMRKCKRLLARARAPPADASFASTSACAFDPLSTLPFVDPPRAQLSDDDAIDLVLASATDENLYLADRETLVKLGDIARAAIHACERSLKI
ncbi:uncharacterized protein V1510DRAFT_407938 [Dipodascopsis tothii]|uniref:uncharacterized protein n=1 Tax=Dipodascopsis tothii TaxID=44089 RepID=UPI0034CF2C09